MTCGLTMALLRVKEATVNYIVKVKVKSLSHVWFFATPWTVAHQAPPSRGFSRQEYWSGLPFPSPGDLPDPGIEPRSPTLEADALTSEPLRNTTISWPLLINGIFLGELGWIATLLKGYGTELFFKYPKGHLWWGLKILKYKWVVIWPDTISVLWIRKTDSVLCSGLE